jgi:hypothetical protein
MNVSNSLKVLIHMTTQIEKIYQNKRMVLNMGEDEDDRDRNPKAIQDTFSDEITMDPPQTTYRGII